MRFTIGRVEIGTAKPVIIAGPCTVHSREQTIETALQVKAGGADLLRGGAYKPRTSPYSFQGLGLEGLKILAEASELTGLPIVSEVLDQYKVEEVGFYAEVLQIGARNMQNFALLQEVGKYAAKHDKAVLLKTGPKPKLKEVLCAAEYLALEYDQQGKKPKIILCER
ncbi:MAG: 3-deoxy-7-phosphoheptulonate synthase, partial [Nanoarchaeota archaeon]|nr:3-deoxy-7-phosphoheptulonate synthase [Nanoarchaeota archaeon]